MCLNDVHVSCTFRCRQGRDIKQQKQQQASIDEEQSMSTLSAGTDLLLLLLPLHNAAAFAYSCST
jgi:hypothetical protein